MIQDCTAYRVLRVFLDYPTRHFQLREICRLLRMGMPSVTSHVRKLERQGFVRKEKRGVYESYVSTRNDLFKLYKRNDVLLRFHDSGLVGFLADKFVPDGIVLFGSASRGEDVEDSDIDLLVISSEKKVELEEFEKKVRRRISLHFEEKMSKMPKELLNNIVNGIVVYGYLEVFEWKALDGYKTLSHEVLVGYLKEFYPQFSEAEILLIDQFRQLRNKIA